MRSRRSSVIGQYREDFLTDFGKIFNSFSATGQTSWTRTWCRKQFSGCCGKRRCLDEEQRSQCRSNSIWIRIKIKLSSKTNHKFKLARIRPYLRSWSLGLKNKLAKILQEHKEAGPQTLLAKRASNSGQQLFPLLGLPRNDRAVPSHCARTIQTFGHGIIPRTVQWPDKDKYPARTGFNVPQWYLRKSSLQLGVRNEWSEERVGRKEARQATHEEAWGGGEAKNFYFASEK